MREEKQNQEKGDIAVDGGSEGEADDGVDGSATLSDLISTEPTGAVDFKAVFPSPAHVFQVSDV
jgi:hypothetical protein